jgi:hypothetical protein
MLYPRLPTFLYFYSDALKSRQGWNGGYPQNESPGGDVFSIAFFNRAS